MRIAIVNDISLARELLRGTVEAVSGYKVVWTAKDGAEAVAKVAKDRPDVILMDLVMPVMDGVEATRQIMQSYPCPILVVTSSVTGNFDMVYAALSHGALDAVNIPSMSVQGEIREGNSILERLDSLEKAKCTSSQTITKSVFLKATAPSEEAGTPLLVMGASTGGPEAMARILSALPTPFPTPIVLVQQITSDFAPSLAGWLKGRTKLSIRIAEDGMEPEPGKVYLAATNGHVLLTSEHRFAYQADPRSNPYRPSLDVFFNSLVDAWKSRGVAVVLTGMGSDGARGLLALRQAGWFTLAQDEATSVVYAMPEAAAFIGAVCQVLPLHQIAQAITARIVKTPRARGT